MQIPRIVEAPAPPPPVEPVAQPEAVLHAAAVAPVVAEPVMQAAAEPQFEAADLHFNPNISRQRLAFRGASGRVKAEEEEQPKRNWVHRLFHRETPQVSYSIIPTDDEDDIEEVYEEPAYAHAAYAEPIYAQREHRDVVEAVAPVEHAAVEHAIVEQPVVEPVAAAYEEFETVEPVFAEAAHHEELPVAAEMEPVPEVQWQPLAAVAPTVEEAVAATAAEAVHEHVGPVFEHAPQAVAETVEAVAPVETAASEQHWESAFEPVAHEHVAHIEPVAEAAVAHVAAEFEEPTAESVNSVVEPLVEDVASVPHAAHAVEAAAEPEFEVSMPLVPMSSDFAEPTFEPLPDLSTWATADAVETEPVHVAEETYRPAAAYAEPEQIEHVEPVYAAEPEPAHEPEPVYAMAEQVAPVRTHRDIERPAHAPRRFHLLSQFDRPLAPRSDARESNGGSR